MKQAAGIVVEHQGKILLLKRSSSKKLRPAVWNLPGGGVESGEEPLAAAIRELREEAGIILQPTDVRFVGVLKVMFETLEDFYVYHYKTKSKPAVIINEESSEFGWFSILEVKQMELIQGDDEAIFLALK